MPSEAVFVDTMALLALANRDDAHHDACRDALADLARTKTPLVTSDWVLAEFLNAACRRPLRAAAVRIVQRLRKSQATRIVPASRDDWVRTLELFEARRDKEWSFVDCSSILICGDQTIRRVLTGDRHFSQAGLELLLT